jgi:DNA mismatch repair protein MutS2
VATTHYNRLKMYAETTFQVRNAAMEFDESTLEPTYRLIHGLAGQSSGLRIAERLKMPGKLIAVARQALDRTELDAARYVDELKVRVAGLEAEKDRLEAERESFERWKRETSQRLAAERADELVRLDRRLDGIIADIRKHASEALKSLGSEAVNRFDKRMKRVRSEAGTAIRREEVRTPGPVPPPKPAGRLASAESIREGSRVRILSLGLEGAVAHVSNLEVEVTVGNMKMRRPFSDLEPVDAPSLALPKNVRFEFGEKRLESNQINLIGRNAEEARDELDKFLDDAFLARLTMVRIVHGHGMGVLRRAVGEVLEVHPHIERFEPAPPSQGGTGATLAFLRD